MKLMQDYSNVNNMQWRNEWALSSETRKWLLDPMIYMDSSHFLSKTRLTLSGQCSHFIQLESTRNPLIFWCFRKEMGEWGGEDELKNSSELIP